MTLSLAKLCIPKLSIKLLGIVGIITTLNKLELVHSEFKTLSIVDLIVALRISVTIW